MKRSLQADLAKVRGHAFRRTQDCIDLLKGFHSLRRKINSRLEAELLWNLYDWLTAPLTLWPVDFVGIGRHVLVLVKSGRPSDAQLCLLLRLIGAPPNEEAQCIIGAYEHDVSAGRYEKLVRQQEKFVERERQLAENRELREAWREIKGYFKIEKYQHPGGVIRRRMSQERNFREGWEFNWRSVRNRFQIIFDALCYRWDLYGFERDKPLLEKISINPTPHGTMIVIPRHWSLDNRRDLRWREISKLHGAHGATRQGPKMSMARLERRQEALAAKSHWDEATRQGLRGDGRYAFVMQKLGKDPRTDESSIKRLLRIARGG